MWYCRVNTCACATQAGLQVSWTGEGSKLGTRMEGKANVSGYSNGGGNPNVNGDLNVGGNSNAKGDSNIGGDSNVCGDSNNGTLMPHGVLPSQ